MILHWTSDFKKGFKHLPQDMRKQALKKLDLLLQDFRHPSLHVKKMEGYMDIGEARISRGYRFTFEVLKEGYKLRKIGNHDILNQP